MVPIPGGLVVKEDARAPPSSREAHLPRVVKEHLHQQCPPSVCQARRLHPGRALQTHVAGLGLRCRRPQRGVLEETAPEEEGQVDLLPQRGQGQEPGPCLTRKRRIQTGDGALCSQYLLAKEGAPPGAGGGLTQGRWPRPLPAPPPAPSLGGGLLTG